MDSSTSTHSFNKASGLRSFALALLTAAFTAANFGSATAEELPELSLAEDAVNDVVDKVFGEDCGYGCCVGDHEWRLFHCQPSDLVGAIRGTGKPDGHSRHSLADKHVPAGLMGGHLHDPGEVMIEYKYMNMYMEDNRLGTDTITDAQALAIGQTQFGTNFGGTPTQMTMEMHMIHVMYGLTDNITVYAMPTLLSNTMDHIRGPGNPLPPGTPFTTHISGFGDTSFGALNILYEDEDDSLVLNFGFSVPTGEIDRNTTVPTGGRLVQEFPYPMRLGKGTFNLRPGVTYRKYFCRSSFGMQFQADLPIDENWDNYSLGDEYRLSAWYAYLLKSWLALSYRLEGLWLGNYSGADPDVNPRVISTVRPDMRGGDFINFGYGLMLLAHDGHLLNFEAIHPVYQDVDGIQLERDWQLVISWSKAF